MPLWLRRCDINECCWTLLWRRARAQLPLPSLRLHRCARTRTHSPIRGARVWAPTGTSCSPASCSRWCVLWVPWRTRSPSTCWCSGSKYRARDRDAAAESWAPEGEGALVPPRGPTLWCSGWRTSATSFATILARTLPSTAFDSSQVAASTSRLRPGARAFSTWIFCAFQLFLLHSLENFASN